MDEINVIVVDRKRKNLYLRYIDPNTGKVVEKSAKTKVRAEAIKAAGKWQAELREGRYQKPNQMTWEAFREYYANTALQRLKSSSQTTYEATLNVFEKLCCPQKLADITPPRITAFETQLRRSGRAEATIRRHLRHLGTVLRWAHGEEILSKLPKITMPKRGKGSKHMRGRAVTTEEFERMLEKTPKIVGDVATPSWLFYLRGLWESGLRIGESLVLRWDDAPGAIVVDFSERRPMLRVPAEAEKANEDRLLPITPQFENLLKSVPVKDRNGRVFKLLRDNGMAFSLSRWAVGPVISQIGEAAGIIVDEREVLVQEDGKEVRVKKKKFASAHDLRRGFGQRLAMKVMPPVLQVMMRHKDIQTTMKYYVGRNAQQVADIVHSALGDTSGDTTQQPKAAVSKKALFSSGDDRS